MGDSAGSGLALELVELGPDPGRVQLDWLLLLEPQSLVALPPLTPADDLAPQRVGFFLNSQSREAFTHYLLRETSAPPNYRYLDKGSAVVVPGAIPLFDDGYQWLRPPTRRPEANPLRPVALAIALVASAELLARIDRFDEQYPTPYAAVAALPEESDH